jgi:hypothetical protein
MGMFSRRPLVDKTDNAFQAFARLMLANDTDMFLERLLCVEHKGGLPCWKIPQDFWDVKLWDINPTCRVSGIGCNSSLIVDGVLGASISSASQYSNSQSESPRWRLGSDKFRRSGKLGKPQKVATFFIVFSGYTTLQQAETSIPGTNGQLSWSKTGSIFSSPSEEYGSAVGQDPMCRDSFRSLIEQLQYQPEERNAEIFTLVDTLTMTATLFLASKQPRIALSCGDEGGVHRVLLCSYDESTQVCFRETVLRMERRVSEKMHQIERLELAIGPLKDSGGWATD